MWDFKFSRRRVWNSESSGMYWSVLNWMSTDVSEVCAASIIRVMTLSTTHSYLNTRYTESQKPVECSGPFSSPPDTANLFPEGHMTSRTSQSHDAKTDGAAAGLRRSARGIRTRYTHRPYDGGSTHLWNVGRHTIKNTAVHPRRFWASLDFLSDLSLMHCADYYRYGHTDREA
jgi:hypothetical protein